MEFDKNRSGEKNIGVPYSDHRSNVKFSIATFFIYFGLSAVQFHSILFELKGFKGNEFTALITAGSLSGITAPFIIAFVARYFPQPVVLLSFLLAVAFLTLPLMPFITSFYIMLTVYFIYTFCMWGTFPLHTSSGMEVYRSRGYGTFFFIRALGTLGFVIGCLLAALSIEKLNFGLLYIGFGIGFIIALLSLKNLVPDSNTSPQKPHGSLSQGPALFKPSTWINAWHQYKNSLLARLLLPVGLLSCANSMAISIQGNYILNEFEGTRTTVSLAWFICSGCEIPIMFLCIYLLKKWNLAYVLAAGMLGTCIRLAGMNFSTSIWELFLTLILHGFFYAGIATGLGICIDRTKWKYRSSLQAMYSLIYAGIPHVFGGFMAGFLWDRYSINFVYQVSMYISLSALIFFIPLFPKLSRRYA
jgi:MFS family permease